MHSHTTNTSVLIPGTIQRLAWAPLWALFGLFGSFRVMGRENVASLKGPIIIASNHISELDPLLIVAALPFFSRYVPLFYVSREKGFYKVNWRSAVYGGNFFTMMGAYPAYSGLNNYEEALRNHLPLLKRGRSVGIFPMGGIRPRDEEPLQPKGGAVFLSHATGAPIIPVSITGAEQISYADFFGRKRKIRLAFGKPVYASELLESGIAITPSSYSECEAAAKKLMRKVAELD